MTFLQLRFVNHQPPDGLKVTPKIFIPNINTVSCAMYGHKLRARFKFVDRQTGKPTDTKQCDHEGTQIPELYLVYVEDIT